MVPALIVLGFFVLLAVLAIFIGFAHRIEAFLVARQQRRTLPLRHPSTRGRVTHLDDRRARG